MTESSFLPRRIKLCRTVPLLQYSTGFIEPRNNVCMAEPNEDDYDIVDEMYEIIYPIDGRLFVDPTCINLGEMIGEGHHSDVYEGTYKSMPVAVKIISRDDQSLRNTIWRERFQREVTLLSRMNHENIIKLVGTSLRPISIIVMELIEGGTLQKFLSSIRPIRLDIAYAITLAIEISEAMEYVHSKGIIHRDLKPSNILLTKENKIKLADFGHAREEVRVRMSSEAGTYRWMAPEVFTIDSLTRDGKLFYDHKVDVYSFSMILWELVVNRTPFEGKNSLLAAYAAVSKKERPSVEDVPEDIANLLNSCWEEDPRGRPEFKEITEALKKYLHKICPPEKVEPESESKRERESKQDMNRTKKRGGKKLGRLFTKFLGCFRL